MATVYRELIPEAATFLATAVAPYRRNIGTATPVPVLAFNAATDSAAFWHINAINYGSGNLTLDVYWYADTATSGDVIWGAQIAAITPNTDTQDIETDTLATAATATDTHLGTTGQRLHQIAITISSLDSLANRDDVVLRFYRDADAAGDTMTGDAFLRSLVLSYSDT